MHIDVDFAMSYASNGELLTWIRKLGCFDEECTRFYTAEIVLALEYMHGIGIIHRCVLCCVELSWCQPQVIYSRKCVCGYMRVHAIEI
jgi:hypothetical protein